MEFSRKVGVMLLISCILFTGAMMFSEVDADPEPTDVIYCYTYHLGFDYVGGTDGDITVDWQAQGYDSKGNPVQVDKIAPLPSADNGWSVVFDPEDVKHCEYVIVTQTVSMMEGSEKVESSASLKAIIVADLKEGEKFEVRFHDGYTGSCEIVEITYRDHSVNGGDLVVPPFPPERQGYSFLGWFTDLENNVMFDSTAIVTSDVDVYAKWVYTDDNASDLELMIYVLIFAIVVLIAAIVVIEIRHRKT